jgi:hypothetical protein
MGKREKAILDTQTQRVSHQILRGKCFTAMPKNPRGESYDVENHTKKVKISKVDE